MSKKVKIIVSVVVAVLLLTVATTATVMAQEEEPVPTPEVEAKGILARVADILGIPEEDLLNAFRQAQQEMNCERQQEMNREAFIRVLDRAVGKGLITQEEASEIEEWWENKPEALDCLPPGTGLLKAKRFQQMIGVPRGWGGPRTPRLAE